MYGFTYKGMAGGKGLVLQHEEAAGAVTGRAVELTAAAVADVTCGIRNLPAVDEHSWILTFTHCGPICQNQVV